MTAKTRWEQTDHSGYGRKFAELVTSGADMDGEARLADALLPRGSRVLDAGCGMGRIGASMRARGHDAYGVDLDAALLEQSRATYPDFPIARIRLDDLDAAALREASMPTEFDLVVCVGNVMILLAEGTEVEVLHRMAGVLAPGGRMLVGFHTDATPGNSRVYSTEEFEADARAAGLELEQRYGSYELQPYDPDGNYAVHVLHRAAASSTHPTD